MAEGIMRLPLSVLDSDPETFIKGMEERGFVVLTDLGSGEEVYAEAMTEFRALCAEDDASKARATSRKVYRNERGVPMWFAGFEGGGMREAFRVCTGAPDIEAWPLASFEKYI
ncbi:hypothetical protein T484DRAFT_1826447 [Baffinella frigidus]|nr:hypothetical protein T484DRAFT_1826447 [Cryptophyta sp. CCMP2293]